MGKERGEERRAEERRAERESQLASISGSFSHLQLAEFSGIAPTLKDDIYGHYDDKFFLGNLSLTEKKHLKVAENVAQIALSDQKESFAFHNES